MPLVTGALATAGVAATAFYVDAKLHVRKDLNALNRVKRAEKNYAEAVKANKPSGFFLFQESAHRFPHEQAIWSRRGTYTWSETYAKVCQYGRYFLSLGVQPHTFVALYSYNSPDFLFIWLGLLSIGAAPALINYNLASEALVHCLKLSGASLLVHDAAKDCVARIEASREEIRSLGLQTISLTDELKQHVDSFPPTHAPVDCFNNISKILPCALLYTSGTTGLPKAMTISASRNYASASLYPKTFGQRPGPKGDRVFYSIPLYHGTGGLSSMNDLMSGISVAIVPKFSLSNFWPDVIASKSTIATYVGEIVRFLLSAPPSPRDTQHSVRLFTGNGMSPELWAKFQERFHVPEIGEFYASTEGALALIKHYHGQGWGRGAVGHHGWLLRWRFHDTYVPVSIDAETGEIWRDPKTGFAKRLPYEEGGELLVKLPHKQGWQGYFRDEAASVKKRIENVFEKGDVYYRTGDALRRDSDGHWYFLDRLGDTYRWKGENVSTTEVTQVIANYPEIAEVNVYGVKLPSHDGRAGCAAVVLRASSVNSFNWKSLAMLLRKELPAYAVPVFIRVREGVATMSTDNYKHNKVPLRNEGVDPAAMGTKVKNGEKDKVYWLSSGSDEYVPFTKNDWSNITLARARL